VHCSKRSLTGVTQVSLAENDAAVMRLEALLAEERAARQHSEDKVAQSEVCYQIRNYTTSSV
jgi:hypothetical protein